MMSVRTAPLLFTLALAACNGGGGDGPSAPPANLANVFGSVHVLGGTTRVPGVTVNTQGRSTTSDASGNFAFTGLAAGSTDISLMRAGYRATTITVTLAPGDNTVSIALELTNCPQIGGVWQASWANACGVSGRAAVNVQQTGCDISLSVPIATISGVLPETGSGGGFRVELPASCPGGPAPGGFQPQQGGGEYWLPFGDGTECCRHGSVTLLRR